MARALLWLLSVCWASGIFYLSHQAAPLGSSPGAPWTAAAHLALYGSLALLLHSALVAGRDRPEPDRVLTAGIAFALAVLYGVTDEVHQAFVAGRTASEADLVWDAFGAFLGAVLAPALLRILSGFMRDNA